MSMQEKMLLAWQGPSLSRLKGRFLLSITRALTHIHSNRHAYIPNQYTHTHTHKHAHTYTHTHIRANFLSLPPLTTSFAFVSFFGLPQKAISQ